MLFPQAMIRLVWFTPEGQIPASLELLSQTGAFHMVERSTLGNEQDFMSLKRSIQTEKYHQFHQAQQQLNAMLPDKPLLNYRFGELSAETSCPQGKIYRGDRYFLCVGDDSTPDLQARKSIPTSLDICKLTERQRHLVLNSEGRVGGVGGWCVIDGWVPAAETRRFSELLQNECFVFVPAEESGITFDKVPSLFKRPRFLDGFASLMGLYGTTAYREIDPTPILAIGFTLMFGMMFADLGQGLLLFLFGFTLYSQRISLLKPQTQRVVGGVLVPVGLSAMFFGAMFGSVFAYEDKIPALLFDPTHNVLLYLSSAVLIGVCLICIGMGLGLLNAWRSGRLKKVWWNNFGPVGLIFYLALIAFVLGTFVLDENGGWAWLGSLGLAIAVIGLVAMAAHNFLVMAKESLGLRLFSSLLETYDFVMRFFVQTLSFVRIAAFTFAHFALSTAVIIAVDLFSDQPLLAWVTLIIGNLLITIVEGALVSIQAIRLHFFELFTKFVSGGGVAFSPLAVASDS